MRRRICTIVGTSAQGSRWSPEVQALALMAGECAARIGWVVLTGGRSGVMAAAAEGARRGGGLTVGILPGTDVSEGNEWLDIVLPSGVGFARNAQTALACDVMLALPGGLGTMQEVTYALEYGKPVASTEPNYFSSYGVVHVPAPLDVDHWLRQQFER